MKYMGPTPAELKKTLLDKWNRGVYLHLEESSLPIRFSLGKFSARQMTDQFDELRCWISLIQEDKSLEQFLVWETVNHRILGKNSIPGELLFKSVADLAYFLGRQNDWKRFNRHLQILHEANVKLGEWGRDHPLVLLDRELDLMRLLRLWKWMIEHPRPCIYLRQIDLPEIDTKFTENHKKILSQWLDLTLPEGGIDAVFSGVSRFEERYGYRKKPELIRFRFLDGNLKWRGADDISIPAEQFCRLFADDEEIPVCNVFVVENDICGLSFPPVKKGMVVFGRGYHFDSWKEASWLNRVALHYWGDIDTHGFAILDQFRYLFPHTRSLLMDRKTLLSHESSWGEEPKPNLNDLENLTDRELELYDDLRFNRIRSNLRLEQEFIRFGLVESEVADKVGE